MNVRNNFVALLSALLLAGMITSCQSTAETVDPVAVVESLYQAHGPDKNPVRNAGSKQELEQYFTPKLADQLWQRVSGGNYNLNFDPLHYTQGMENSERQFGPARGKENWTLVPVKFNNINQPQQIDYHLELTDDGWRIANIFYPDENNLESLLIR